MPEPWRCPECRAWIAPHVIEHRCDPPSGAVPAVVTPITPSGGGSVTTGGGGGNGPTVITLHTAAHVDGRALARVVQSQILRRAQGGGASGLSRPA